MSGLVYYHGGRPGLKPGDYVLPASQTGARTFAGSNREMAAAGIRVPEALQKPYWRADRVYVTTWKMTAFYSACRFTDLPVYPGKGTVYRVVPEGEVSRDPAMLARGREQVRLQSEWDRFVCDRAWVVSVEIEECPNTPASSADERKYWTALNAWKIAYLAYLRMKNRDHRLLPRRDRRAETRGPDSSPVCDRG